MDAEGVEEEGGRRADRAHFPILRAMGEAVASRRTALGLTQSAVARECEFHRSYVSTIEQGLRNPTLVTLACLASALDCRLSDLLRDAGY
jgi:transcriptional regulator with XRE-family HTH domain